MSKFILFLLRKRVCSGEEKFPLVFEEGRGGGGGQTFPPARQLGWGLRDPSSQITPPPPHSSVLGIFVPPGSPFENPTKELPLRLLAALPLLLPAPPRAGLTRRGPSTPHTDRKPASVGATFETTFYQYHQRPACTRRALSSQARFSQKTVSRGRTVGARNPPTAISAFLWK